MVRKEEGGACNFTYTRFHGSGAKGRPNHMHLRNKSTLPAAVALPLAGLATFGGSHELTALAAGGPTLLCTSVTGGNTVANSAITFTSGGNTTGISLDVLAGFNAVLLDAATNGQSTITINTITTKGQTLSVAGFTGTYQVLSDSTPGSGVESPDTVTLTVPSSVTPARVERPRPRVR